MGNPLVDLIHHLTHKGSEAQVKEAANGLMLENNPEAAMDLVRLIPIMASAPIDKDLWEVAAAEVAAAGNMVAFRVGDEEIVYKLKS